jgi:hypothetical protein
MKASENRIGLSKHFPLDFFAVRAYRFLSLVIVGALVMLFGIIACYREIIESEGKIAGLWVAIGCFLAYSAGAVWYGYRIAQGTWWDVWIRCIQLMDENEARRKLVGPPCPPISAFTTVLAFLLTGCLAILFGRLFSTFPPMVRQRNDWLPGFFMLCSLLVGSGTLVAVFYDRTWWNKSAWAWIIGFNFLTMFLALIVGVVIITLSSR